MAESKSVSTQIAELEARKAALRAELEALQGGVSESLSDARKEFVGRTEPIWWVKRYPLVAAGAAFAIGMLIGSGSKGGRRGVLAGMILNEIKTAAAKQAIRSVSALVEGGSDAKKG